DLAAAGYTDATAPLFAHDMIERVRQLPGVQAATIAAVLPGGFERISLAPIGFTASDGRHLFSADWNVVEPGYFSTLTMAIVSGRDFTAADREQSARRYHRCRRGAAVFPGARCRGPVRRSAAIYATREAAGAGEAAARRRRCERSDVRHALR